MHCITNAGQIGGTKFNDLTGDGFSSDDTRLGGVTIKLYADSNHNGHLDTGDALVASQQTVNGTGSYLFSNLAAPGTYFVQEVVPSGWTQTDGGNGSNSYYTVVLPSAGSSLNNDFDNFKNVSISGTKFQDCSGNGFSSDDTPLAGITIVLYKNGGSTPIASTVTAANGTYSFSNLGPGTYAVQEVVPAGYTQTGGNAGYTIVATSGTNSSGNNFDNFKNATTPVTSGDFATIGFWQNKNGQKVINSFNGSSTSTALGNWLATTFPNLFGTSNPYTGTSLAGKTNAQVAAIYSGLWTPNGVTKNTYVQAFAVALGIYSTTSSLGGASLVSNKLAAKYGFHVTAAGSGNDSVTIGSNSSAFGTSGTLTVTQIMQIVNSNFNHSTGTFYGGDQTKTSAANNVLNGINTNGDINIVADGSGATGDLGAALLLRSIADLHTGTILVAIDPLDGDQAADELARIADAIASLNVQLGNYGVSLEIAGAENVDAADIYIHIASTSDIGGMAEGVLGVTEFGGEITIITGWNYYYGTDPTAVGADQYDFQTVATHELSHAIGLGHSADAVSVMFPYLATATARHTLSADDMLFIDNDAGMQPEALMAMPSHAISAPSQTTPLANLGASLPTEFLRSELPAPSGAQSISASAHNSSISSRAVIGGGLALPTANTAWYSSRDTERAPSFANGSHYALSQRDHYFMHDDLAFGDVASGLSNNGSDLGRSPFNGGSNTHDFLHRAEGLTDIGGAVRSMGGLESGDEGQSYVLAGQIAGRTTQANFGATEAVLGNAFVLGAADCGALEAIEAVVADVLAAVGAGGIAADASGLGQTRRHGFLDAARANAGCRKCRCN